MRARPKLKAFYRNRSFRKAIEPSRLNARVIPFGAFTPEDVVLRRNAWLRIQRTSWDNKRLSGAREVRHRSTAVTAERTGDVTAWYGVSFNLLFTAQPIDVFRAGEKIGDMRRATDLLALFAVTQMELGKVIVALEGYFAAKAAAVYFFHSNPLCQVLAVRGCIVSGRD